MLYWPHMMRAQKLPRKICSGAQLIAATYNAAIKMARTITEAAITIGLPARDATLISRNFRMLASTRAGASMLSMLDAA